MQAWVLVGEEGVPDSLIVEPAGADGTYEVRVPAGVWEVYAVVDVDGSGSPGGAWYDVMGYAPQMPVTVVDQDLSGVDVNVESAYAGTGSWYEGAGAYLVGVGARVMTATGEELAGEATVTVTGGDEPIELDPDALAQEWAPYCAGGVPMDGATDYTYEVSHPEHYEPSVTFTVTNTPRDDRPLISAPTDGDVTVAGAPVVVEWSSPDGDEASAWVQLWWRGDDAGDEPIWDEMGPGPSMEIPAGALGEAGAYSVVVLQASESYYAEGGVSQAWGLDEVFFSVGS